MQTQNQKAVISIQFYSEFKPGHWTDAEISNVSSWLNGNKKLNLSGVVVEFDTSPFLQSY